MISQSRILAVVLTLIVALSAAPLSAGSVHGFPGIDGASPAASGTSSTSATADHVTEVDSCGDITEPGHYRLTSDLESSETCIRIGASNVTLDGDGHTVSTTDRHSPAVEINGDHVTVTNLTVTGGSGIQAIETRNTTIRDSRIVDTQIELVGVDHVVENTTLDHSQVYFNNVDNATATGLDGDHAEVIGSDSHTVTVRDSNLHHVKFDDTVAVTIANNSPDATESFSIHLAFMAKGRTPHVVTNNTITGNSGDGHEGTGLRVTSVHKLSVTNNRIVGNDVGISIDGMMDQDCIPGRVDVHGNSLANNTEYGISYARDGTINATSNYWGPDGPSSVTTHDLEDPHTGTLADGDGSAVSANPENETVSNVHFDPWLDHDPTNETADD